MNEQVVIVIEAQIPYIDFSTDQRSMFVHAVVALFKGMFPNAVGPEDGSPPITVEFGSSEELR